jgi:hypothetical protein
MALWNTTPPSCFPSLFHPTPLASWLGLSLSRFPIPHVPLLAPLTSSLASSLPTATILFPPSTGTIFILSGRPAVSLPPLSPLLPGPVGSPTTPVNALALLNGDTSLLHDSAFLCRFFIVLQRDSSALRRRSDIHPPCPMSTATSHARCTHLHPISKE